MSCNTKISKNILSIFGIILSTISFAANNSHDCLSQLPKKAASSLTTADLLSALQCLDRNPSKLTLLQNDWVQACGSIDNLNAGCFPACDNSDAGRACTFILHTLDMFYLLNITTPAATPPRGSVYIRRFPSTTHHFKPNVKKNGKLKGAAATCNPITLDSRNVVVNMSVNCLITSVIGYDAAAMNADSDDFNSIINVGFVQTTGVSADVTPNTGFSGSLRPWFNCPHNFPATEIQQDVYIVCVGASIGLGTQPRNLQALHPFFSVAWSPTFP